MVKQYEICKVLEDGVCRSSAEIRDFLNGDYPRNQINTAIGKLVMHGMVERQERGCFIITKQGLNSLKSDNFYDCKAYKKPKRTLKRKQLRRTIKNKIWSAIRIKRIFTVKDLLILTGASADTVSHYVRFLYKANYISLIRKVKTIDDPITSNGLKQYLLVNDTGPNAPIPVSAGTKVFDPNTDKVKEINHAKK